MTDRELMQQALEALEALEEIADEVFSPYDNKLGDAILALRAAIERAHGDWDEVEALRESLREHMAEIKRLRAVIETNLRDDRRGEKNT